MDARRDATEHTKAMNDALLSELPFEDRQDFEDAERGFIAPLIDDGLVPRDGGGPPVWDPSRYAFIEEGSKAPDTVNPSLWRQSQLVLKGGLFKVCDRLYQVRNADISNLTIVEGDTGLILMDPLISTETSHAALELYFQHRPRKDVVAVIHSHSHVDHYGGVKGVTSEADVASGKTKIIAPEGFLDAAVSENVLAGNVMTRRGVNQYGSLLPIDAKGQVGIGLGSGISTGTITLIPPTDIITETGQKMVIDGLTFEFLLAPDTEAPSEMHWFIEELGALTAAENCCHTLHNTYTLRGAQIRDPQAWSRYLNETLDRWGAKTEVLYGMHHWPVWGTERVADMIRKGRGRVPLHQRPDAPAGGPRLHPGRDRRDDRAAAGARPPLGAARLLRHRQPQRQGHLRQVSGLVRREPGDALHPAARAGVEALRRVHGRRRCHPGEGPGGVRQG